MIKVGLQIPNFTYPDTPPGDLFERVAAVAVAAEDAGADTVMVMDHFYQLPMMGPPDHEMFEAYTLLGALAARTEHREARHARHRRDLPQPRHPRQDRHHARRHLERAGRSSASAPPGSTSSTKASGVDFPPVKERFERLEEALVICRAMFRGERPTIEGKHYRVKAAINSPGTGHARRARRS